NLSDSLCYDFTRAHPQPLIVLFKGDISFRLPPRRRLWFSGRTMMASILIVDDDDIIRDTLYELLSTDYQCQTAETAETALAKLEAQRFDVVLTDISMPGLSGVQLLNRVLKQYPGTPVIMISGLSDQDQAVSLIE